MTDNDTRTLLERACAKAVDIMLSGDVATVRQGTGHHVITIRTVESEEREARTIQRRVEHAERTKQDTERELSRVADELAHVRETGAAELARASDDLVGAAAEIDALRAELARQTGIAVDHCARADAAEQMVVELGAIIKEAADDIDREDKRHVATGDTYDTTYVTETLKRGIAALSRTEAVAGRWVSVEHFDAIVAGYAHDRATAERDARTAMAERDAAIARAEKAEADNAVLQQVIQSDATQLRAAIAARDEAVARRDAEVRAHYAAIDDRDEAFTEATAASRRASEAERARDEVGIQLAAAQERLRQASSTIETMWAAVVDRNLATFDAASAMRARWDSVPGDALAPVVTPGEIVVDERGGRTMTGDGLPFDVSTARRAFQCVNGARPEVWQAYYAEDEDGKDATVLPDAAAARAFVTAPVGPPSPAGASAPASGSTPAASSATSSSSEVAANPSAPRGMCDRITAALEASGIDTDNVKGGE